MTEDEIGFCFATNSSPETSSLVVWDAFKAKLLLIQQKQAAHEQNMLMQQVKQTIFKKHVELKTRLDLQTTYSTERRQTW